MAMTAEEDPEEAAAWAALREAFGEPGSAGSRPRDSSRTSPSSPTRPTVNNASGLKIQPAVSRSRNGATSGRQGRLRDHDGAQDSAGHWLQAEVDRLVGEVQRVAGQPFSAKLIQALWRLPLEEQQDALLGACALSCRGDDTVWQVLADEVHARGDKHSLGPAPAPPGSRQLKKTKGPSSRPRSRSRSPSI
ncbi:unnamed protein product [Symbiodinium natans]|uniref:Uncharacterized protein n=1 Tax=Symbiodinium natans TaxID=878477 RepID=A0A812L0X1_9DINO|nr:unnamed protein product [Symbiodinium natans]